MHDIKIKSPANVFMERIQRFCGWIYHFSISLTLVVLQRQKAYRILAVLPFKMLPATLIKMSLKCVPKGPTKQRVLMHGHQGWNVRHGLCHIYMRYVYIYIYIWVVYSLCFFCCLFITVTWWYVRCFEWASRNQEEVQACLVTLWLSYHATVYTKPLLVCYAHDLKIIHIFINTQWIFMFNVSI